MKRDEPRNRIKRAFAQAWRALTGDGRHNRLIWEALMKDAEKAVDWREKERLLMEALNEARRERGSMDGEARTLLALAEVFESGEMQAKTEEILDEAVRVVKSVTTGNDVLPETAVRVFLAKGRHAMNNGDTEGAVSACLDALKTKRKKVDELLLDNIRLAIDLELHEEAGEASRRAVRRLSGEDPLSPEMLRLFMEARRHGSPCPEDLKFFEKTWSRLKHRPPWLAVSAALLGARLPQEWNHGKALDLAMDRIEACEDSQTLAAMGVALTVARRANGERAARRARRYAKMIEGMDDGEHRLTVIGFCVNASALSAAGDDEKALMTVQGMFPLLRNAPGVKSLVLAVHAVTLFGLERDEEAEEVALRLRDEWERASSPLEVMMTKESILLVVDVLGVRP